MWQSSLHDPSISGAANQAQTERADVFSLQKKNIA